MIKIILTAIAMVTTLALTDAASAQQRTLYDSSGRAVVRSVTGSNGAVTSYDAQGRVISRETTSRNRTTTIYDAHGHTIGRVMREAMTIERG